MKHVTEGGCQFAWQLRLERAAHKYQTWQSGLERHTKVEAFRGRRGKKKTVAEEENLGGDRARTGRGCRKAELQQVK